MINLNYNDYNDGYNQPEWCDTRFYFWGAYVCANFGENRSRNATMRVPADRHTDRRKPIL